MLVLLGFSSPSPPLSSVRTFLKLTTSFAVRHDAADIFEGESAGFPPHLLVGGGAGGGGGGRGGDIIFEKVYAKVFFKYLHGL